MHAPTALRYAFGLRLNKTTISQDILTFAKENPCSVSAGCIPLLLRGAYLFPQVLLVFCSTLYLKLLSTHAQKQRNSVGRLVVYRPPPRRRPIVQQIHYSRLAFATSSPEAPVRSPCSFTALSHSEPQGRTCSARATLCSHSWPGMPRLVCVGRTYSETPPPGQAALRL